MFYFRSEMQKEEIRNIHGIGEVLFVKSKRAKRIGIRINGNTVRVAVPRFSPIKEAIAFVELKKDWIISRLDKIENQNKESIIKPDEVITTKFHRISFIPEERSDVEMIISSPEVSVYYPSYLDNNDPRLQKALKVMIAEVFRKEAKQYLPVRLKELAQKHGFKYNQLRIKNIKSRWGSCSSLGNINLSLHLMNLPYHLIDLVILHELCHLKYPNHGNDFHSLLEKLCPNVTKYEKEMKQQKMICK